MNLADTYVEPGSWTSYDIFSMLSGVAMIALVFVPGLRARERVLLPVFGVGLIIYDMHVRSATSGTYYFPVQIFVVPFLILGLGIYRWYQFTQRPRSQSLAGGSPLVPSTPKPWPGAPAQAAPIAADESFHTLPNSRTWDTRSAATPSTDPEVTLEPSVQPTSDVLLDNGFGFR